MAFSRFEHDVFLSWNASTLILLMNLKLSCICTIVLVLQPPFFLPSSKSLGLAFQPTGDDLPPSGRSIVQK